MEMTARELITLALKKIGVLGVGQTPLPEDINDGFTELNLMIGQWASQRYMLYHLVSNSIVCTGAQSYSLGPTGDIVYSERPSVIESAFVRLLNNATAANRVDYPLMQLPSREDYDRVPMKLLNSFPQFFWYDAAYPNGLIYPLPIPNDQYSLHVTTRMILSEFASLDTTITLPPEYYQALLYNLAALLATSYDKDVPQAVAVFAKSAKEVIRGNNAQIPNAVMPAGLSRGQLYNIYGDYTY